MSQCVGFALRGWVFIVVATAEAEPNSAASIACKQDDSCYNNSFGRRNCERWIEWTQLLAKVVVVVVMMMMMMT